MSWATSPAPKSPRGVQVPGVPGPDYRWHVAGLLEQDTRGKAAISIASRSVLGRILDDVRSSDDDDDRILMEEVRDDVQLLCLGHASGVGAPPFATTFHFWGRFMRRVLEAEGRGDAFDALVGNGLCDRRGGGAYAKVLNAVAELHGLGPRGPSEYALSTCYRMIDEPEMVSWVAEGPAAVCAFVWARAPWLRDARPIVRD